MGIDEKDRLHGAVFAKIVEHKTFISLNKFQTKGSHGCYTVNDNKGIYVKYCKKEGQPWQFNFQPDDIEEAWNALKNAKKDNSFLCLVCGWKGVCILPKEVADLFLDVKSGSQKTISINRPKAKGGFRLISPEGEDIPIPLNAFPKKLFSNG